MQHKQEGQDSKRGLEEDSKLGQGEDSKPVWELGSRLAWGSKLAAELGSKLELGSKGRGNRLASFCSHGTVVHLQCLR